MSVNNVKNSIGWCDYTINPIKGLCPMDCKDNQGKPYCYARRIYKRFKLDETIRFDVVGYYAADWGIKKLKTPSKIFVGSTMELFGDWVEPRWLDVVFQVTRRYPQHTFIFLTKQPQNLIKFSPYPENCWIGVSATNQTMIDFAMPYLAKIKANVKFLSLEPLLEYIDLSLYIGYNKPIYREVINENENERGNNLSSCESRGIGDRRTRQNLENQEQIWNQMGKGSSKFPMRTEESGKRYREISASKGNGELAANLLSSPQVGMETLSRVDTREIYNQSQEWQQERQQTRESRTSDIFRKYDSHDKSSQSGSSFEATGQQQCDGKTNTGSGEGNKRTCGSDNSRIKTSEQSQSGGVSKEIQCGTIANMECDLQKDLEINLIIIGCETRNGRPVLANLPKIEWIKEIVEAADKVRIPVFLKDNLRDVITQKMADDASQESLYFHKEGVYTNLRQEFPLEGK